jgi:hypothetical protein
MKFHETIKKLQLSIWVEIQDNNNLELLLIEGKATEVELILQWFKLNDEFIKAFGLPQDYLDLLETKREACLKMAEYCQTLDRFTEFESKILIEELNAQTKTAVDFSITDEKGYIEESLGFWLDPERITVYEYYSKKKQAQRKWQTQSKITT